jgi:hypothetical protein
VGEVVGHRGQGECLIHGVAMDAAPCRHHDRQHGGSAQSQAHTEASRLGVAPRIDFRMAGRFELLERSRQRPALALESGHACGRGLAQGDIGPALEYSGTVACGLSPRHPETPTQLSAPLRIAHLHTLFGHGPWLDVAHGTPVRDHRKGEARMLRGDEPGAPTGEHAQQGTGTKSPGLTPEVARRYGRQPPSPQRALGGMAVFARQPIAHQAVCGLIDHQGFPRQGPGLHRAQHCEASRTRFKTVASQPFHPIPRHSGHPPPLQLLEQRRQLRGTLAYQLCRGGCLAPGALAIDRDAGGAALGFLAPIRRAHRGCDPQDDLPENVLDRRQQHGAGIWLLGGPGTPGIEVLCAQDALQCATYHHGNGALFHTPIAQVAPQLTVVTHTSARSGVAVLVKDAHAASEVPSATGAQGTTTVRALASHGP